MKEAEEEAGAAVSKETRETGTIVAEEGLAVLVERKGVVAD